MKMAELERRTGVGRETIRYYIREGLLPEPERRARNVAVYGDVHVEQLRTIKRLQEERFLPLEVIRKLLAGDPSALPPATDPFAQLAPLLAARLGVGEGEPVVALDTLIAGDPQTARDVEAFAKVGAIEIRKVDRARVVSRLDARVVAIWRDVRRAGYGPAAFPAEMVSLYIDALAPMAVTEVERFFAGFEGRVGQGEATERAQAGVELINALIAALRTRLILDEVARRAARP